MKFYYPTACIHKYFSLINWKGHSTARSWYHNSRSNHAFSSYQDVSHLNTTWRAWSENTVGTEQCTVWRDFVPPENKTFAHFRFRVCISAYQSDAMGFQHFYKPWSAQVWGEYDCFIASVNDGVGDVTLCIVCLCARHYLSLITLAFFIRSTGFPSFWGMWPWILSIL